MKKEACVFKTKEIPKIQMHMHNELYHFNFSKVLEAINAIISCVAHARHQ